MSDDLLEQDWDFIVVGGGINGLAIGALLSTDGKRVLVLEKSDRIGGRINPTEKNGFILDNGLHLLKYAKNSALCKVLKTADIPMDDLKIWPIRNYYVYIGLDDEHLQTTLKKECINKNKWTRKGWLEVPSNVNLMRHCDYFNLWKLIRIYTTCFKCEYNDIKDKSLRKFLGEKKLCRAYGCVTIERYLKLISTAVMHCSDPHFISAGEIFRALKWMSKQDVLFGYPEGGWKRILDALETKIEKNGAILKNCEVEQLLLENNRTEEKTAIIDLLNVKGVKTNKGTIKAPNVILAIGPGEIPPLFVDKGIIRRMMPEYQSMLDNLHPVAGISIDFALSSVQYKSKTFMYVEDPPGYGATISNIDPSLAPEGKQLMSFFFPIPGQMLEKQKMLDDRIEKCKNSIYKHYPKAKDHILFERVLVHDVVDNVQVDVNHYWDKRPKPKMPGIRGCYMTGDFLRAYGASGELGYNSVLETFDKIKKMEKFYLMNQPPE